MTRIVAIAACAVLLASAAPACAQTMGAIQPIQASTGTGLKWLPGMNNGQVNRVIPGTPGLPGTVINPDVNLRPHRAAAPAPLYHDGLARLGRPSVDAANRTNGTVGQQGVSGVQDVSGVRPVGSGPINQHKGASRPSLVWAP